MKKLFLILLFCLTFSSVNAEKSPEELCFEILNEQVSNDSRFQNTNDVLTNWNLTNVLYSQWLYADLSTYENFRQLRATNSAHNQAREANWHTEYHFLSRRTNIATIITQQNLFVSQVVGFWRDSNFDFPVQSKTTPFGDKYSLAWPNFKEFVLYTHHNFHWEFMSCGLFRLIPLNWRTLGNVAETWYFTNVLTGKEAQSNLWNTKCNSWFHLPHANGITREWKRFLPMRTNVCAIDYAENDFVKQEILAIAYDNNSPNINEYDIFQLQVQAMKNTDTTSEGMFDVRTRFLDLVTNKTCFRFIHGSNPNNLPANCNWEHKSWILSFHVPSEIVKSLWSFIFPQVNAINLNYSDDELNDRMGLVIFDGMPFKTYKKLQEIPNQTFIDYINVALTPNFEDFIIRRRAENIVLTPFEEIFISCGISYQERQDIIIDFIENLDNPNDFDIANLSYSNPRFWDCIIPFPDRENRDQIIEWSFNTNQLLALQLSWEYEPDPLDQDFLDYIEAKNKLELELQNQIDSLTQRYNEGSLSWTELQEKISILRDEYSINITDLDDNLTRVFLESETQLSSEINKKPYVITITALLILWLTLIFWAYIIRNKKS